MKEFKKELEQLINKHSRENDSNTPDFILAQYICNCLDAFTIAINKRMAWYGKVDGPGVISCITPREQREIEHPTFDSEDDKELFKYPKTPNECYPPFNED